jgi:hypothetical protein
MSSTNKVSFRLDPIVHLYKKRKAHTTTIIDEARPAQSINLDQGFLAPQAGQAPPSDLRVGLKINVPTPGEYRAPSASPPPELSPETVAEIIREVRGAISFERANRLAEEEIRQVAIGNAQHAFHSEDTPPAHLTPNSQRTPASVKSLLSPHMNVHLSPLQLSPLAQSPRVSGPSPRVSDSSSRVSDSSPSPRPRIMLKPIAEKNSLMTLSLESLRLSNSLV